MVKNCENSVFRVIFVKKKKEFLGSGLFSRDGRVTGNKHLLFVGPTFMKIKIINITLSYQRLALDGMFNVIYLIPRCSSPIVIHKLDYGRIMMSLTWELSLM